MHEYIPTIYRNESASTCTPTPKLQIPLFKLRFSKFVKIAASFLDIASYSMCLYLT